MEYTPRRKLTREFTIHYGSLPLLRHSRPPS